MIRCSDFRSGCSYNSASRSRVANAWPKMTTVHDRSLAATFDRVGSRQFILVFPLWFDRCPFSRFVWKIQNERSVDTTMAPFRDEQVRDGPMLCLPCVSKKDRAMAWHPVRCRRRHCRWLGFRVSTLYCSISIASVLQMDRHAALSSFMMHCHHRRCVGDDNHQHGCWWAKMP